MRIAIKTLGCKANRYESDRLFVTLKPQHQVYNVMGALDDVDILIVNTCTVTQSADKKSRQAITSFKKLVPHSKLIVFGCGSNVSPLEYRQIEGVDFVAKNTEDVLKIIEEISDEKEIVPCNPVNEKDFSSGERTRALLKIQDGCNRYCTYCIIPRARGKEVSFPLKQLCSEAIQREKEGYKEIVITGITVGQWKEVEKNIGDLIEALIKSTKNIRFRISSIEPKNFSQKFYKLFSNSRLCNHIHMSLQSGSDTVLKRMRRGYTTKEYVHICRKLRKISPDIGLTTDVIVGFPGETEKEFKETCKFVKDIGFLKVHIFPYSKRKNTAAYYMAGQISEEIKKSRAKHLQKITDACALQFKKSQLNKIHGVLVHRHKKDGFYVGFTSNYIPMKIDPKTIKPASKNPLFNQFVRVYLKRIDKDGVTVAELSQNN
ncbi:MAG: tRNA (N(6)-L-threonylcarbamoyladenosine(37)-C(2))-methylthiotransferase MtaB [Candidatus Gracilibacteria bacterium]|jgi:threonylcarbamoyladenosine tRNA methylthiotransferase MtaB